MNTVTPTKTNLDLFNERLAEEYVRLFRDDPEYAYSAQRTTPQDLARKMTLGLASGSANKDGEGIRNTCRHFKLPHTYKAIRAFFNADDAGKSNSTV
jgi:hypothetical protein